MATLSQSTANAESQFSKILDRAITQSSSEGRNNAGFWLDCQLRDDGFTQADAEDAAEMSASSVGEPNYTSREDVGPVRSPPHRRLPLANHPVFNGWGAAACRRP